VCGHIHRAEIRDVNGVLYCNDGDWVESRSALVENMQGELSLLYWQTEPVVVATSADIAKVA
jgi:UDP-2,3-diacylglucosamine pyrophosphatase LpxH